MSSPNVVSRIKRELNAWKRRHAQGGNPETRRRLAREIKNWAALATGNLEQEAKAVVAEFRRLWELWSGVPAADPVMVRPLHYAVATAHHLVLGGWAAVVLEGLCAAGLAAYYLNAPAWLSAIAGAGVAILVAVLFKGGVATRFIALAEEYPVEASRRLRIALWVTTALEAVLLLIVFLVRNATGDLALKVGWMFGPTLSLLSVLTPLYAAMFFSGAVLHGWSLRKTQELDGVQHVLRDIRVLCHACDDVLPGEGPSSGDSDAAGKRPPGSDGKPPKDTATRFVAAVAIAALLPWSYARAQDQARLGMTFVDKTDSVEDQGRSYAVSEVQGKIPEIILRTRVTAWQGFLFDSDPWQVPPVYTFQVPSLEVVECKTSPPSELDIFKGQKDARQRADAAKCKDKTAAQFARFQQALGAHLGRMQQFLEVRNPTTQGCTAFWDVIRRMAASPVPIVGLIISDGVDSCQRITEPIPAPVQNVELIVVLVASRKQWRPGLTQAEQFQRRATEVRKFAPWVRSVVPPWGVMADVLTPAASSSVACGSQANAGPTKC